MILGSSRYVRWDRDHYRRSEGWGASHQDKFLVGFFKNKFWLSTNYVPRKPFMYGTWVKKINVSEVLELCLSSEGHRHIHSRPRAWLEGLGPVAEGAVGRVCARLQEAGCSAPTRSSAVSLLSLTWQLVDTQYLVAVNFLLKYTSFKIQKTVHIRKTTHHKDLT